MNDNPHTMHPIPTDPAADAPATPPDEASAAYTPNFTLVNPVPSDGAGSDTRASQNKEDMSPVFLRHTEGAGHAAKAKPVFVTDRDLRSAAKASSPDGVPEAASGDAFGPDRPSDADDPSNDTTYSASGGMHAAKDGRSAAGRSSRYRRKERSPYVTKRFLAIAIVFTVILSSILSAGLTTWLSSRKTSYDNLTSNNSLVSATGSKMTIEQIVQRNQDAVVEINTKVRTYGNQLEGGAGSGVIVNKKGYIATNYHVISGAKSITVTLHNNKEYDAQVVGYDQSNDIAVLKINGKNFTAASIGKSASVKVGDLAIAIGNPLGQLGGTATSGIISSLDRQLTIDNTKLTLLQTDASINPGNSGGGLFNGNGELIGIVVAKSSGSGIEGLGFAIPIDTAAPIIDDIIDHGTIHAKPAAGITIYEVSEDQTTEYKVDRAGVYIADVYGSHAKKAGLRTGDRIVQFEGKSVRSSQALINAIQKHKIGDKVAFTVEREGQTVKVTLALEDSSKFTNYSSSSESSNGNSNDGSNGSPKDGSNEPSEDGSGDLFSDR